MAKYRAGEVYDFLFLFIGFVLGPFYIFPKERWLWILPIFPILFAGRWLLDSKWLTISPISGAVALLIVWILFGVIKHTNIAPNTAKLAGLSYGILMFLVILAFANSEKRIGVIATMFLLGGMIVAGIGTLSRIEGISLPQIDGSNIVKSIPKIILNIDRAEAGINPNPLGGTLLLFIPLGIMIMAFLKINTSEIANKKIRYSIFIGVAIILSVEIFALIYSRSSGAWLGFGIILLMIGEKRRLLKFCLGFTAVLAFFFISKSPAMKKIVLVKTTHEVLDTSAASRIQFWSSGLEAARTQPLFGLGLDRLRETPPLIYKNAHAHNQFINIAAEAGIPALIAYLAILIGVWWMVIEVARSKMPEWMRMSMKGLGWGQIGFAIFGIADAIPLGSKPGLFFWISLSLMTSIYLYGRENKMITKMVKGIEANT